IAIVLPSPMGEHIVVVHEQAQFAGDVDTLSGHRAIVTGRARGAGVVLEIERARLVALVQLDAELSEILLRAFIMRRALLLTPGRGDLVVIGSRYCASAPRPPGVPTPPRPPPPHPAVQPPPHHPAGAPKPP